MKKSFKIKFTDEELWSAYSEEIIECMVKEFKISTEDAVAILKKSDLEKDFMRNRYDFEFIEPARLAKKLITGQ